MNTFDYILLVLLVLSGITGFHKGLITGLSRLIGNLAAIGIAVFFHKPFLNVIEPVFGLEERLKPKIVDFLTKIAENKASGTDGGITDTVTQSIIGQTAPVLTDYILKIGSVLALFILVVCIINIIIALVITPLAKNLSFINRGGGFIFGLLTMLIVLSLILGFFSPILTTADIALFKTSDSLLFPWFMEGYDILLSVISAFAGDIFRNPLESIPLFQGITVL
ncbi:CvpA family protein [Dehalobacter sp. DCM]|uniref:CvpA family protein n=1 Tax=Dehalobacter sp. DCM TaxID=2907827 RepID=UPI003081634F|nr:CvpA family protein [Dehalobacter sp. DCM]